MNTFERYKKAVTSSGKLRSKHVWASPFALGARSALDVFGVHSQRLTFGSINQDFRAIESDMEAISRDFSAALDKTVVSI